MTVEILYSEVCNLFGDIGNVRYLEKSLPDSKFIYTRLGDKPYFADNKVNLIYLGSMSESVQELVIRELEPYKSKISDMISDGTAFIITGSAVDIFGKSIVDIDSGEALKGLGIVNMKVTRDMNHRYSGFVLAERDNLEFVGFQAQFTQSEVENSEQRFLTVKKGRGMNESSDYEGIKINNFYATNLLGPFLLVNPLFSKKLLSDISGKEIITAFENEAIEAYKKRVEDFKNPSIKVH